MLYYNTNRQTNLNRRALMDKFHDTAMPTGLYGKNVDFCIQALIEHARVEHIAFGNRKIKFAQHLYIERDSHGQIVLTYDQRTQGKTPLAMKLTLLGFYFRSLLSLKNETAKEVYSHNDEDFQITFGWFRRWDEPYFKFQRNDYMDYENKTVSFKYGFALAVYDILSGLQVDEARKKYGGAVIDEIVGTPNDPFQAATITELKQSLLLMEKPHQLEMNQLEEAFYQAKKKLVDDFEEKKSAAERAYNEKRDEIRRKLAELGARSDY